jgi:hypothetical protein
MADRPSPLLIGAALAPTRGIYLSGDDHLRITTFNAAAGVELAIEGRYLDLDGRLVPSGGRHVPNTDRTAASTLIRLGEGWLLDVTVRASAGTPRRGQCFALLELVRGFTGAVVPVALLSQGYVTDTARFGWPQSIVQHSTEGRGVIRAITGTDPAAGVEISETVPTNARWELLAIGFALVTDATAANREVTLTLDNGTSVYTRSPSRVNHTASLTRTYSAFQSPSLAAVTTDPTLNLQLPRLVLSDGHRIRTATSNLQAGDNYGAPQLLVEEWIED